LSPGRKKRKGGAAGGPAIFRPPTTPVTRAVDQHYTRRLFGEPEGSLVFDAGRARPGYRAPKMLDVPYWTFGGEERDLTRFATVGMSEVPLEDGTRIELHHAIGRDLAGDDEARSRLSIFLAALADFPFRYETSLARGNFLGDVGEIPSWPGFAGIFLDGLGLGEADPGAEAVVTAAGERIDLHLAVPVLAHELELLRRAGPAALLARWRETGCDRFDPGRSAARA
jgi:hypothetical protein